MPKPIEISKSRSKITYPAANRVAGFLSCTRQREIFFQKQGDIFDFLQSTHESKLNLQGKYEEMSKNYKWICWIMISFFLVMANLKTGKSQVNPQDSLILVEFYNATNGDNWFNNDNWLVTPVFWWHGVTLVNDTFIQTLYLPGNGLNGTISPLLCQLSSLWGIDLSDNNLSGQIPDCLGSSGHFSALVLDNNHLSGSLPESFGYSADSITFDLLINNNNFEGIFPDTIIQADMISRLEIKGNRFTSISRATSWLFWDLYMENNCFTFEDIIPYKLNPLNGIFTYSPQDSVLSEIDTTLLLGSTLVMDAWVDTCYVPLPEINPGCIRF